MALFCSALENLDKLGAQALFAQALQGRTPLQAVEHLVVPALDWVGRAWDEGHLALSQVYMAGRLCEDMVLRVLPPSDPDRKRQPRSAIVTLNDHHLLGKRIVHAQMRASGFELFDYGRPARVQLRMANNEVFGHTGVVQTIEVLRSFKALGYQPKHTIQFVLFANDPKVFVEKALHILNRFTFESGKNS